MENKKNFYIDGKWVTPKSNQEIRPPVGDWSWSCSVIANEGFTFGKSKNAQFVLNASELALLQRLLRPELPFSKDGEIMGPFKVWMKLLNIVELWIGSNLNHSLNSVQMLKKVLFY